MSVGIVTDTSCDLPLASLLRLGVAVVPQRIRLGEALQRDWRDLDPGKLYELMKTPEQPLPEVLPPEPEDFINVYWKFLQSHDQLISIHLSSKLSLTLENAQEAARTLLADDRIVTFDSAHVSVTLAEMVITAAELARDNMPLEQIIWSLERIRQSALSLFSPESLDWLSKHEQLQRGAALLGTVTRQRPLFAFKEGLIIQESQSSYNRVAEMLVRSFQKQFSGTAIRLAIGYGGDDRGDIEGLKRSFELAGLEIIRGRVQMIGSYLGCIYGPGTLMVCAYPDLTGSLNL